MKKPFFSIVSFLFLLGSLILIISSFVFLFKGNALYTALSFLASITCTGAGLILSAKST